MSGLASMLPAPKANNKKSKGPAKILLDLPKPSESVEEGVERPAKKLKLGSGASSGLAAMLPAPKNENPASALPASSSAGPTFVPKSVKQKQQPPAPAPAAPAAPAPPKAVEEDQDEEEDDDDEDEEDEDDGQGAGMDFFGLGSVATLSKSKTNSTSAKGKTKISSAPTVQSAARLPSPSPPPVSTSAQQDDEAPHLKGWRQLPSGEWVPTTQEAYEQMVEMQKSTPGGFSAADIGRAGGFAADVDDSARRAELERERQRQMLRDGVKKASASKAPPRPKNEISRLARQRHQLTSLIDDAAKNHDLLEEKLAIARANKKSAGLKYGF